DDAVQVEEKARRAPEEGRRGGQRAPPPRRDVPDRLRIRLELGEVARVAERLDRGADGRVDEAAGPRGGSERDADGAGELLRDGHDLAARAVDARELAVRPESAEEAVALVEEPGDRAELVLAGAADDDLAAHRAEGARHDDDLAWTCGVLEEGAWPIEPLPAPR